MRGVMGRTRAHLRRSETCHHCPTHAHRCLSAYVPKPETLNPKLSTPRTHARAEIHDMLSLGMLIEAPAEPGLGVLKEIVFMAHHLGLTVNFTPISAPDYERWVAEQVCMC